MTESQTSRQRMNLLYFLSAALFDIVYNLDDPIVIIVANCGIAVARNLMVEF
jgi:hypothetical protein